MWLPSQPHKYNKEHSPSVVLKIGPYGSLLRGGGPGNICTWECLHGEVPVREGSVFSRGRKVTLPLLCMFGWCGRATKGSWKCFLSFFLNPFQSIPFLEKPQSLQQSPSPSVLKNTHLLCYPLLLWVCFKQHLIQFQ